MKNFGSTLTIIAALLFAAALAACSQKSESQPAAAATETKPAPAADAAERRDDRVASELDGTAWRLVKIMGMDDSVDEPEDRSLYTLEFSADGHAAMRADCNRAFGPWTSESPGQLQFGPIAATRAMCPPESLSDKYLAQFEWVRSYVLNDGNLFLATMADGAIIEFEPAPSPD